MSRPSRRGRLGLALAVAVLAGGAALFVTGSGRTDDAEQEVVAAQAAVDEQAAANQTGAQIQRHLARVRRVAREVPRQTNELLTSAAAVLTGSRDASAANAALVAAVRASDY